MGRFVHLWLALALSACGTASGPLLDMVPIGEVELTGNHADVATCIYEAAIRETSPSAVSKVDLTNPTRSVVSFDSDVARLWSITATEKSLNRTHVGFTAFNTLTGPARIGARLHADVKSCGRRE